MSIFGNPGDPSKGARPLVSLLSMAIVLVAAIFFLFSEDVDRRSEHVTLLITVIVAQLPSMIAAMFAEQNHKAITNGTVQMKAREGARQALREEQVLTRDGPVVSAQLEALSQLLVTERANDRERDSNRDTARDLTRDPARDSARDARSEGNPSHGDHEERE